MTVHRELKIAAFFAAARFAAFILIAVIVGSTDAQWQLGYLPLWATDFPLSLTYRFLPFPLPEAVLGPAWWFGIGLLMARWRKLEKRSTYLVGFVTIVAVAVPLTWLCVSSAIEYRRLDWGKTGAFGPALTLLDVVLLRWAYVCWRRWHRAV